MISLVRLAVRAAAGKRHAPGVARFMLDVDRQCRGLARELDTRTYRPATGHAFAIVDPKPRRIYALPFRDRVAQHALIDATLQGIERTLAPQTHACRVGRGTHVCLRRAIELTRTKRFVLRVDFTKFFASIDHAVLRTQLDRTTPRDLRWLRDVFIDAPLPPGAIESVVHHFPGDDLFTPIERPHGLPIGSLTSQIWANLVLSPIDHLLADHLGLGTFVRYCDDILVFDDDPGRLRNALAALHEAAVRLRLRPHVRKTRLHRTRDPVRFLGFVLQRRGDGVRVTLAQDNVQRMRQRVAGMQAEFAAGGIELDEVTARVRAWLAHAAHGHTRALLRGELARWTFCREGGPG